MMCLNNEGKISFYYPYKELFKLDFESYLFFELFPKLILRKGRRLSCIIKIRFSW